MKITHQFLEENATSGCGWNKVQLRILGVKWPAKKGWKSKLIGKEIDEQTVQEFKKAKGELSKRTLKMRDKFLKREQKRAIEALKNDYEANYNLFFDENSKIHSASI